MRRKRTRPGLTERALLQRVDPGHQGTKRTLQVLGPTLAAVGGILTLIGFLAFASAFGGDDTTFPTGFFLAFIGLPLLGIGVGISKVAFLGEIGRYGAGELAPVARDTLDYLGVGDGGDQVMCANCGASNEPGSKFCEQCGQALMA